MLEESLALLLPQRETTRSATFVDATFGAGGHTEEILARRPGARVIALDADPAAVERARELAGTYGDRLVAVHANFAELTEALRRLGVDEVDGILYDLGLSSLQLADNRRGFSFSGEQPLDMRLDPTSGDPTAADLLGTLSESDLADLIYANGDERFARRIARQIVERRVRTPLKTSSDLVSAVLAAQPHHARRSAIHPATRTFQALRMAVNHDVERIERGLDAGIRRLRVGGRAVAISFHSGEDRVVKRTMLGWNRAGVATTLTRKPLPPTAAEAAANPRSRSAKLRAAERITEDPAWR